jgi:putative endopeptidase
MRTAKNRFVSSFFLFSATLLFICSCGPSSTKKDAAPVASAATHPADALFENRDTTLRLGDDFFLYSNNGWFKAHPIPPSESSNGIFLLVQDSINNTLRIICDSCSKNPGAKGTIRQKIGDFYASGLDTLSREKEGMNPLKEELAKIDAMKDKSDILHECIHLHTIDCNALFGMYVSRDDKNSSKYAFFIHQGGLGLPDRDYYFNTDARTKNIRSKYEEHVAAIFKLSGEAEKEAVSNAATVLNIESALAKSCRKIEALRDPYKNYNKMTIGQADKLSPSFEWRDICKQIGLAQVDTVIIGQPEFVSNLETMLKKFSVNEMKAYFKWKLMNRFSEYLGSAFETENFHFNHQIMTGSKEQKPRWKRMVELTEGTIGDIVAQEYVAHYVPADTKERLNEMGKNIVSVYAEHLKNLDWMSAETKTKALHKLNGVVMKMGYPDKWKDFSKLDISRTSLVTNIMHVDQWYYDYMISHYGKPVDRTEWNMTPETYNAYYEPTNNEIVIPACNIIVPGFGKSMPDDAVLYGVVGGSTMGHEITHGFDDEGSQYDELGNLHDWWTKSDRAQFNERSKKLAAQFDKYVVLDSLHVRGMATLGENIADLGGVIMGYEAFKKTEQWKKHESINGLSPDQRYFMAYAYSWMMARRNEALAKQIMSDVHAPAQWRVNGPVSNITAFYDAFHLKAGDKMYREEKDRVRIW